MGGFYACSGNNPVTVSIQSGHFNLLVLNIPLRTGKNNIFWNILFIVVYRYKNITPLTGGGMSEQRKHQRISCDSQCDLVNRDGSSYPALLSDISSGGALVRVDGSPPLNSGDLIALKLNEDAVFHPIKSISRIVRTDSKNNYGLRFLVASQIFKNK